MELILLSLYWYYSPMPKFLMCCVISIEKSKHNLIYQTISNVKSESVCRINCKVTKL